MRNKKDTQRRSLNLIKYKKHNSLSFFQAPVDISKIGKSINLDKTTKTQMKKLNSVEKQKKLRNVPISKVTLNKAKAFTLNELESNQAVIFPDKNEGKHNLFVKDKFEDHQKTMSIQKDIERAIRRLQESRGPSEEEEEDEDEEQGKGIFLTDKIKVGSPPNGVEQSPNQDLVFSPSPK